MKSLVFMLVTLSFIKADEQEKEEAKFPTVTYVTLLKNNNFDNITHLGCNILHIYEGLQPLEKPWFIFFFSR